MIEITYHRSHHRVTIKGHGGDPAGQDIYCAGVSTLATTLAANMDAMYERGQLRERAVRLDPGDAEIAYTPVRRWASMATHTMDLFCNGFYLLAQRYPDRVSYTAYE